MTGRRISRRTFRAAGAVGLSWRPSRAAARLNLERLRVGVVGCGFRGKYLIANLPDAARVVALGDCSLPRVELTRKPQDPFTQALATFAAGDGRSVGVFQDYRRLLDETKLDALIIATPDHHHVGMALAALAAGLDVYVEKPLTLTIAEGRKLVDAARRTGRVVQVGSQQRTMAVNRAACEFIRNGGLGRVSLVELPNYPGPATCPTFETEPPSDGLDWNLFCGPAPLRPQHRRVWVKDEFKVGDLLWRGWDLWREFSGHMMTNWGAHSIDMVQMALGRDADGPVEIRPEPELIAADIDRAWRTKTPPLGTFADEREDRMRFCPVTMRYADGTELRFRGGDGEAVYHGERGRLYMRRNQARSDPPELFAPQIDAREIDQWTGVGHVARPHLANWLDCIATRGTPNAPLEAGHRTATVCHLANLARQLGRTLRWNPQAERFIDDPAADALLDRPRRAGFELPQV
jgi:predicted dehydrogenase